MSAFCLPTFSREKTIDMRGQRVRSTSPTSGMTDIDLVDRSNELLKKLSPRCAEPERSRFGSLQKYD